MFIPADVVRQAAAAVAEREGLAEDWLNDAVKGFLPGPAPGTRSASTGFDSLIVDVASPRYLLAMKLFAARAEIDADDIILLYRQLGFTTVEEGLDLIKQAYPRPANPAQSEVPPRRNRDPCNANVATNGTRQHGRRGSQCDQIAESARKMMS